MEAAGVQLKLFLQPLTDIHLHSHLDFEISPNGDIRYVYLFLVIAFIVLMLACINFMNLSTARSEYRSKEIGMRKVVGANRGELIGQFLGESTLLASIAIVIAGVMVEILLPSFEAFVERDLVVDYLKSRDTLLVLIGSFVVCRRAIRKLSGTVSVLRFQPVLVRSGGVDGRRIQKKSSLAKDAHVVVQFSVSTILIVGTGVVDDQAELHSKQASWDFSNDHVIIVPYGNSAM